VGPLRAKIIAAGDPCVQDAVITGLNRDDVGALLFPRPDECRAGRPGRRRAAARGAAPPGGARLLPGPGRPPVARRHRQRQPRGALHVLAEPPSIDKGEVTDKGSINQRAVLQHRDALVEALYEGRASDPS
jgi:feruloyl-CoA synthase